MVLKLRENQRSTACNFLDSSENTLPPSHPGKIFTSFILGKTTRRKKRKKGKFQRKKKKEEGENRSEKVK
jgi:hypothetical protein